MPRHDRELSPQGWWGFVLLCVGAAFAILVPDGHPWIIPAGVLALGGFAIMAWDFLQMCGVQGRANLRTGTLLLVALVITMALAQAVAHP